VRAGRELRGFRAEPKVVVVYQMRKFEDLKSMKILNTVISDFSDTKASAEEAASLRGDFAVLEMHLNPEV
jgi:hypothetical protein